MSKPSSFSSTHANNWLYHNEPPLRPLPTITPSKATLEALENIAQNTIPLLGFAHPNRGPIPSSIRNAWEVCEQTLRLRDLVTSSSPVPFEGQLGFGLIGRPVPNPPPTPPPSPVRRGGGILERDAGEMDASRRSCLRGAAWSAMPYTSSVRNGEEIPERDLGASGSSPSGPKQRHDSYHPPTPVLYPVDDGDEPNTDAPANTFNFEVNRFETGRDALEYALRRARNRRLPEWRRGLTEVLAREPESLMFIMRLADRGGMEY